MQVQSVSPANFRANLEANKDRLKAEIYDAAMVLLRAQHDLGLASLSLASVTDLSELCRKIELGEKISGSPLLDL